MDIIVIDQINLVNNVAARCITTCQFGGFIAIKILSQRLGKIVLLRICTGFTADIIAVNFQIVVNITNRIGVHCRGHHILNGFPGGKREMGVNVGTIFKALIQIHLRRAAPSFYGRTHLPITLISVGCRTVQM